ncbi:MAG: hypothetical protein ACR2OU_21630 [Thermomicrobiales bacterium]
MTATVRRLQALETAFGPPAKPRPAKPLNLELLSVEDRARLEELTGRFQQTGDYSAFTDADLEDAAQLLIAAGAESTRTGTNRDHHAPPLRA